jgi:hypothetical protein
MNPLKRFLIIISIITYSITCYAQSLVKVVENVEATFYVNSDSIRKNGGSVEFWLLTDFKQARSNKKGELYQSMEQRLVIDCSYGIQRLTFIKVYSSSMATGNLMASGPMTQKNPISSGTSIEVIQNFVCH